MSLRSATCRLSSSSVSLTPVEEIEGIARWVDARMREDDAYLPWLAAVYQSRKGGPKLGLDLADPIDRTTFFLALCDSEDRHGTEKVANKFVRNLEDAFS